MHRQIAGRLTGPRVKWAVLMVGVVLFVVCSPFLSKITSAEDNEVSSWLPSTAESTRALDAASAFQDENAFPTLVVYEKDAGFSPADLASMKQQAASMSTLAGVTGPAIGPEVSADGRAAQVLVTFDLGKNGYTEIPDSADALRTLISMDGGHAYVSGFGGQVADSSSAFSHAGSLILLTLLVVVLILLMTYRSPVLWLLPIFSSMVALAASDALVYFLATYAGLTVNGQSSFILTVIVVGAGTDYALLLVARYREELRRHEDRHEAMAVALHRAAPAIIASAGTVALGMMCLFLAQMNSTAGLGPVLAIGIVVTLVVALTLLPALLVIFDRRVFWPYAPAFRSHEPTTSGIWAKVGQGIAKRPRKVWIGTAAALGVACLGVLALHPTGLALDDTYSTRVDSVAGQHVIADHQLTDSSNPAVVVADADHADAVRAVMTDVEGIKTPAEPVIEGDLAIITAGMDDDASSSAAFDTVQRLRDAVHAVPGANALVGGNSALNADIQKASLHDDLLVTPAVLLVVLLVLILLLRSLASPLLLIGTVVLSYGAALGISSLIFTRIFGYHTTDAGFPLFVFVFLVALGIDYNIFLMTRVREETAIRGTREGSLAALGATGGVITSAGLVLAGTFASLAFIPLVFSVEVGTAVALGVLLDTLVVRSVLVTALNLDLGSRIWWPSRLDRVPATAETAPAEAGVGASIH